MDELSGWRWRQKPRLVLSQVSHCICFFALVEHCRRYHFYQLRAFSCRAVWIDLTGDGRRSILTARAKSPSLLKNGEQAARNNPQTGQLVWLEMPKPHSTDKATGTNLEVDGTVFDPFSARHTPWKEQ